MKYLKFFFLLAFCVNVFGQKPELIMQTGHLGGINTTIISSDGKFILTSSFDHTAKIWDVASGREVRTFSGHIAGVNDAVFSPDMRYIATTSDDRSAKLWDINTGKEILTFKKPLFYIQANGDSLMNSDRVTGITFTPDGNRVIIRSGSGLVIVNDVLTGKVVKTFSTNYGADKPKISPDGQWVAIPNNMAADIWNLTTFQKKSLLEFDSGVKSVGWSSDSKFLIYSCFDGWVYVLEIETRAWVSYRKQNAEMLDAALHPDGKRFITLCTDGSLKVFEMNKKKPNRTTLLKERVISSHGLVKASFTLNNSGSLLTIGFGHEVLILEVDSLKELTRLQGQGYVRGITDVSIHPGGRELAATTGSIIHIWDLATAKQKLSFDPKVTIKSLFYEPDGKSLITSNSDGTVGFWNTKTGEKIKSFKKGGTPIKDVIISSDGSMMAASGSDDEVMLWDLKTGNRLHNFSTTKVEWDKNIGPINARHNEEDKLNAIAFSYDGQFLAGACSDSIIYIWDIPNRKLVRTLREWHADFITQSTSLAFTKDGKFLAAGEEDGVIGLWDIQEGKSSGGYGGHHSWVNAIKFTDDEKYLIGVSNDQTFYIWNQEREHNKPRVSRMLSGHTGSVTSFDIFRNQKFLASGSTDGTVKIWDLDSAKLISTLVSIGENDYAVINPDHNYLASKYASKGISFNVNNKIYPFRQFDLKMNRPDLVLGSMRKLGLNSENLAKSYYKAYQKRMLKLNFTEGQLSDEMHLPEVKIISNIPITTTNAIFSFEILATDQRFKLDRINVVVNEVPIFGSKGIDLKELNMTEIKKTISLELGYGKNSIEINVLNEKGGESLVASFVISYETVTAKPDLYVLAIGVSDYENDLYDLTYAAKDANDICSAVQQNTSRYASIKVLSITDTAATKENILKAKKFFMQSKVNDVVMLTVAGHGLLDDNLDYFFGTSDVNFESPANRGLPYEELEALLDGIPARHKLMLIDACHSGEVDKEETEIIASVKINEGEVKSRGMKNVQNKDTRGMKNKQNNDGLGLQNSFELMKELFADLRKSSGAIVISSASGTEFAFESSQWKNGVFTYAILEGLKTANADTNKDSGITVSELRDYVVKKVGELTNGKQHPTSRKENLEFDFKVW